MSSSNYKSIGDSLYEFPRAFGCAQQARFVSHTQKQRALDDTELLLLRKNLIREEVKELMEAISEGQPEHILKELVDVVVVCAGMADTYGWDFDEAFSRVHESNMSKLDDEGQPVYREDGKVLKSDNYKEPNLSDLLESYAYTLGGHTGHKPEGFVLGGIFKDIKDPNRKYFKKLLDNEQK